MFVRNCDDEGENDDNAFAVASCSRTCGARVSVNKRCMWFNFLYIESQLLPLASNCGS